MEYVYIAHFDIPKNSRTDQQTDRQTDRQTLWFIGKLHLQKFTLFLLFTLKEPILFACTLKRRYWKSFECKYIF